jgi:hypothetical protein
MKNHAKVIRFGFIALILCGALFTNGALADVSAQEQEAGQKVAPVVKRGPRDPFEKLVFRPVGKSKKNVARPIPVPTIQERIERYKAQKVAAMNAQQPAPKPTTALLLSEMQVIGISRTPRGYAAMVEATPIKLTYTIYPGEIFYDGQLVAIEEDRLVFRHETRWSDGRSEKTVENKPLRQPNVVTDSMTASRPATASAETPANSPASGEEKAPAPEKQ